MWRGTDGAFGETHDALHVSDSPSNERPENDPNGKRSYVIANRWRFNYAGKSQIKPDVC